MVETPRLFFIMATITALKFQKHHPDRVNIYLDGDFAIGMAANVAAALKIGQELSPNELDVLQHKDEIEKARKSAVNLIGRRPRSVVEIERHLQNKGYEDEVTNQVIEHLLAVDLLNDEAFAKYWVEQRAAFRPRSKLALKQELQQKGINRAEIDSALNEFDEEEAARRVAEKQARRWVILPEKEFGEKLGRFLQQRGFPYDVISITTHEVWNAMRIDRGLDFSLPDYEGDEQ